MRIHLITAALIAASSAPAHAAGEPGQEWSVHRGVFVGARVRIPFGNTASAHPRAGLTLSLEQSHRSTTGEVVTQRGEGVGLDFASGRPVVTLAGAPASLAFQGGGTAEDGERWGMSDTAWIGIGAVVLIGGALIVTQLTCIGKDKDYCGSD